MAEEGLKLTTRSEFRGCILSDAVGLGKSLTALVAALELREELPLIYIAVLFLSSVGQDASSSGSKRSASIGSGAYSHDTLRVYDVVICSHSFVRGLLRDRDVVAYQHRIAYASGLAMRVGQLNMRVKPPDSSKSMGNPLNPGIAVLRKTGISALIFDESQDVKNEGTDLSHTVRDLRYEYAFMLTATPPISQRVDGYRWAVASGFWYLLSWGGFLIHARSTPDRCIFLFGISLSCY